MRVDTKVCSGPLRIELGRLSLRQRPPTRLPTLAATQSRRARFPKDETDPLLLVLRTDIVAPDFDVARAYLKSCKFLIDHKGVEGEVVSNPLVA